MSGGRGSSILRSLAHLPSQRGVAILVRHSIRGPIPPGEVGGEVPLTPAGQQLAVEFGCELGARLRSLRSSPVPRCMQTAECIRAGAGVGASIVVDRRLGDPGVYVTDAEQAWVNWERLGNIGVIEHIVAGGEPLPGMAKLEVAARALVEHMVEVSQEPGLHVFVSHDAVVAPTAAWWLKRSLPVDIWPGFLDGLVVWREGDQLQVDAPGLVHDP